MKAKKLITLCLVGMLAVASTSSVFAAADTSKGYGDADFVLEYSNATGPTDPTDPTDPTGGANNWQVTYPKAIVLSDSNSIELEDVGSTNVNAGIFVNSGYSGLKPNAVVGKQLQFTVSRRTIGTDGNKYEVTTDNVGNNGIKVQVKPGTGFNWGAGNTTEHKALVNMKDSKDTSANGVYMVMLQSTSGKDAGGSQANRYLISGTASGSDISADPVAVLKANDTPNGTIGNKNTSSDTEVAIVGKTDSSDASVGIQDGIEYKANVKFTFTKA